MDANAATECFAALSQDTRLAVFRLLVAAEGSIPAGEIAERLGVPHNTMSTHLAILARAGLIGAQREGRLVRYGADHDGIRALIGFILQDCCQGRPELCAPPAACCATGKDPA
ncbi:metalloregulator ArsR/SmtB family transcription factor [Roseomonas sp. CAU 1739]|uniref:ArsR/SmtB family transcription factor n=1 Tax=Roseomonas sp. CAU 1739 TaxID=3140364 RepID=UPI00325BF6B6